jgi:uncharacterized protein YbjT (DUF2867 family)
MFMIDTYARRIPAFRLAWSATLLAALSLGGLAGAAPQDDGVLILGGTGHTGSYVARRLVARGEKVTVLVRPTSDRSRLAGLPITYVVGDAMEPASAEAAMKGRHFGVVLETLQFAPGDGRSWAKVYDNFVPWAQRTGVKQFIVMGGGCGDREAKDCPLSPPLYALTTDMTRAEHILRDSGVPYTILRIGALLPNPRHPKFDWATGHSYLTTDLRKFGGVMRADLNEQVLGCVRAESCLNKIFVIDDLTLKPQVDHFLCKRSHETDTVSGYHAECGDMPDFTDAHPPAVSP